MRYLFLFLSFTITQFGIGQVQNTVLSGKITDETLQRGIQEVKIEIANLHRYVYSDKLGNFKFTNLAKGTYQLTLKHDGYLPLKLTVDIEESIKQITLILMENITEIPEIKLRHVSITGGEKGLKELPGSAYYLSPKELQKFNYTDPNRILKTIPGVNIQEEDGFGLRPNIGIRGTGVDRSSKITIMEDGILMAPAPYSAPAAYYFPTMARMQGIEILKGSAQIKHGPFTTGGAINFISTQLPKAFEAKVTAIGGSFWGRNIHAYIGNSHEQIAYSVEALNFGSNGFKQLDGGGESGFQKSDYLAKLKLITKKSAKIHQSITFKVGKVMEQSNETYLGLTREDFLKTPYRRYAASQKDQMNCNQTQISALHHLKAAKWLSFTTTVYRNQFQRNWYRLDAVKDSTGNKVGIANVLSSSNQFIEHMAILKGQSSANQDALYMKGNNRKYYGQGIQMVANFEFKTAKFSQFIDLGIRLHQDGADRFQNEDKYSMANGRMFQTSAGELGRESNKLNFANALASHIQYKLVWKKWMLTTGLRNENIQLKEEDFGKNDPNREGNSLVTKSNSVNVLIPGIAIDFIINESFSTFVGIHKGFAPPSVQINALAEESVNIELGAKFNKKSLSGQVVAYYNSYQNLLGADLAASGGSGNGELYNGGKAKAQGIEMLTSYDFASLFFKDVNLPLTLSYTLTDALFLSDFISDFQDWGTVNTGDKLPYLSLHQLNTALSFEHEKFSINLNAKYTSEMRASAGKGKVEEADLIPAYFLVDASAKYNASKNITIFGSITNLLNESYLVSMRPAGARPGMPRAFQIGLKANIN